MNLLSTCGYSQQNPMGDFQKPQGSVGNVTWADEDL